MTAPRRVAVVGAGWAGLSAALTAHHAGHHVTVYERAPAAADTYQGAGGRASTAYAAGERAPFAIDNGQHVLLGAYCETLALLASVGIASEHAFLRLPAAWCVPQQLNLALAAWADSSQPRSIWNRGVLKRLPMALALLKASPLHTWLSVLNAAVRMQWLPPRDAESVVLWLSRLRFPTHLNEHLWHPLCFATLNTPPASASAVVFKRVIDDGLLAGSQAAAMLVPRLDLGSTFPGAALAKLSLGGASLQFGYAVQGIRLETNAVIVYSHGQSALFDRVICATPAKDAVRILPPHCISPALRNIAALAPEPISTIHLRLGAHIRLPQAVSVLPEPLGDTPAPMQHAVAIDRAYLSPAQIGWVTLVLSCSHAALGLEHAVLIQAALERLRACFPALNLPARCEGVVIHAKQATFACTAGLIRPSASTAIPAIMLAGDYVAGRYPATLEGAVRSGILAANRI